MEPPADVILQGGQRYDRVPPAQDAMPDKAGIPGVPDVLLEGSERYARVAPGGTEIAPGVVLGEPTVESDEIAPGITLGKASVEGPSDVALGREAHQSIVDRAEAQAWETALEDIISRGMRR
jgi:hypothetical protein